ncbi:hypothetical protein [Herbidospora sp. RD11066]
MKKIVQAVAVTGTLIAGLGLAAAPAQAAVKCINKSVPDKNYPATGSPKAQARSIVARFCHDPSDGTRYVTVSAQLRDSGAGDGWCARLAVSAHLNSGASQGSTTWSECNGVWAGKSWTLSKTVDRIFFNLYTSNIQSATEWNIPRPSGY